MRVAIGEELAEGVGVVFGERFALELIVAHDVDSLALRQQSRLGGPICTFGWKRSERMGA